jgi:nitronate monooxygenase
MRQISHAPLALAVSRSQGLGFLGSGTDVSTLSSLLEATKSSLQTSPIPNTPPGILPVGIGFICWGADLSTAYQVIKNEPLKPAAVWLFAPKEQGDLITWTKAIREASNRKTKIWIQVGTVAMAIQTAKSCNPDVLVIQGTDAGGHGLVRSSSIITLLPECADALAREGFENIPLIATGGIMDGRGVAAALMLGSSGVCMGTRFLASPEAEISNGHRNDVVKGRDGGVSTARTSLYDKLRGTVGWPEIYNARGVLNHSFWDHEKGMGEAENKKLYEEALKLGDAGWGEKGRITAYAGSGIGLISGVKPAGDIVQEVRTDSRRVLQRTEGSRL